MRSVAWIRHGGSLAVAPHERVLRLRAGSIGAALRMTAEASERVGTSGLAQMDATQAWGVADLLAVRGSSAAPAVLRTERISEQLVPDDEERVDAQHVPGESPIGRAD